MDASHSESDIHAGQYIRICLPEVGTFRGYIVRLGRHNGKITYMIVDDEVRGERYLDLVTNDKWHLATYDTRGAGG